MSTSSDTINHAEIMAVSITCNGVAYDITGSMLEINLYESIEAISVMGDINFLDTHRLYETIHGGESVNVRLMICERAYDLGFIAYAVEGKSLDDRGGLVQLKVAENHYIKNSITTASGMYDDNCSIIMNKLLNNIGVSSIITENTKQNKKLSIPHMKPFEAIELIRSQSSSPTGNKMFVYGTLAHGVIIDSFDEMSKRPQISGKFRYGVGESPENPDDIMQSLDIQSRTIHTVDIVDNVDTLAMVKDGFFGLRSNTIDMFNKSMVTTDFGAGNGVVEKENTPRVNSVTNSSVSSLGWDMGDDRYERAKSHSAFSLLNMVVSPYKFRSLKTIGHTIEVLFPNNIHNGNGENTFDTKRSGLYVITHSRLSITPGKATYTMNAVSKVSNNV